MAREIRVIPYNEKWAEDYQQIKKLLLNIFDDLVIDIQHFGSTSIEGMSAKPIIDVMVIVNDIQKVDDLDTELIEAGYKPKGKNGMLGRIYFQHFHEDGVNYTQHIHVYEKNNPAIVDQLIITMYSRKGALGYKSRVLCTISLRREQSSAMRPISGVQLRDVTNMWTI